MSVISDALVELYMTYVSSRVLRWTFAAGVAAVHSLDRGVRFRTDRALR